MPRRSRCILPDVPCHVTQRGVDHRETFSSDHDRSTYLNLLHENLREAHARLLGWCLMTNHVHLIVVPDREDSLAILLRRVHGRYAQYYNAYSGRTGHLWQNRFFACALGHNHLWTALVYVDRNPVRAGIIHHAADYRWSSAAAHLSGIDQRGLLDMQWWLEQGRLPDWDEELAHEDAETTTKLRRCTYAGRPFGSESLIEQISLQFGRSWTRGRPKRNPASATACADVGIQLALF
jgi:putative transposase